MAPPDKRRKTLYSRGVDLQNRMDNAFKVICVEQPELIQAATRLLESFLKKVYPISLDRFPREHFVVEQTCLVAMDYLERITRQRITCLDIQEDINNLASLYEYLLTIDNRAATTSQHLLRMLLLAIINLANQLQEYTKVARTDWIGALQAVPEFDLLLPSQDLSDVVPSLVYIVPHRILGAGGFGSAFRCSFGGCVIVTGKLVPMSKFRDLRKACADKVVGSMINSPFLVKYHSCFQTNLAFVTLMDYIRGVDLSKVAVSARILPADVTKLILAQLGLAVQYLHYRGFIHRDIKPSNMMIVPGCHVKLIDFDTCKICSGRFCEITNNNYVRKTFIEFKDGESPGTLLYLAPEILKKKPYGRASDWWAVGVTAYQLGTGRLPFRGHADTAKEKIKKGHANFTFGNAQLMELNRRLIHKHVANRITSAHFNDFKKHSYFQGLNWSSLGSDTSLYDLDLLNNLMERNKCGLYSPKKDVCNAKLDAQKKFLTFDKLQDRERHHHLFTFGSTRFEAALLKLQQGLQLSESEVLENPEYLKDAGNFSNYKLYDWPSSLAMPISAITAPIEEAHEDLCTKAEELSSLVPGVAEDFEMNPPTEGVNATRAKSTNA